MANAQTPKGALNTGTRSRGEGDFGRFDFVKWSPLMGGISLLLTVVAFVSIFTKGMHYGIDFAGGTEIEIKSEQPLEIEKIRKSIEKTGAPLEGVQSFGSNREYLISLNLPQNPTVEESS
jgi:preprotein translocase subunit SecF